MNVGTAESGWGEAMTTFGELKCEVCGIPGSGAAMHRANPKGEKGRWRCEPCLDAPPDKVVLAVTDWFEVDNMRQRQTHNHKGFSEEQCVRCGWIMGDSPLNCNNDNTPHWSTGRTECGTR